MVACSCVDANLNLDLNLDGNLNRNRNRNHRRVAAVGVGIRADWRASHIQRIQGCFGTSCLVAATAAGPRAAIAGSSAVI